MLRTIQTLCTKHTHLTTSDIDILYEKAKSLQLTADLTQANLFIDCPAKDGKHAIVVAEAQPANAPSLYSKSVVGKFAYESFEPAVAYTHKTGKPMKRMRAITQEAKYVKQSVVPIKNDSGITIGSLIMEEDISEQVNHENKMKALSETTEQLSQTLIGLTEQDSIISNLIQESLLLLDFNGKILYYNTCAECLIEELGGKKDILGSLVHDRLPFISGIYEKNEGILQQEVNAGKKVLEVKQIILVDQLQITGVLIVIRDLTELREKERQLMVKSAVIQEIHHRVKNNLQTVSSLLRLQMKRGGSSGIQESLNRISSIAAVHEELLESSKIDEVEIKQLIERIGQMSIQSRLCADSDVSITFVGERMYMNSDIAVSLALTINELIQNCLKHAFSHQERGTITITFSKYQHQFEVTVKDNGIGYSSSNQSSLGLDIVNTIVCHDLSGTFSIEKTGDGTKAVITFPFKEVEAV